MAATLHSEDGDIGFQIAPMVDVDFVLMLFFMACAGMQKVEKGMPVPLPGKSVGPPVGITIDISPDGLVTMNDKVLGRPDDHQLRDLRAWLTNAIETFGDKDPVTLRPSPATRHERIMEVLDCARAAKVKNLSFN